METIRSVQVCPDGSVFDPDLLYCVFPDQVPACGGRDTFCFQFFLSYISVNSFSFCPWAIAVTTSESISTTTIESHSSTTPTPIRCEADGFYAFEPCLTVYYACVDGVAYFQVKAIELLMLTSQCCIQLISNAKSMADIVVYRFKGMSKRMDFRRGRVKM